MTEIIYKCYAYLFGRKKFNKFNNILFNLSLRGLGILNYQNDYLTGEIFWLMKFLKNEKSPIIIDVGAHFGQYSMNVLKANQDSIILAFEPNPKSYRILCKNVINDNYKPYNLGVGNEKGIFKLYDYDTNDDSQHASLYRGVIEFLHRNNSISHDVEIVKLDDFLKNKNINNIDLLKVDVEGNEFNVLLGLQNYLLSNKIKAIQFEFNEMNIISKVRFKDFWDLLQNYKLYRILASGELLEIKIYSPLSCEIYAFQNIVALLKNDLK